MFCPPNTSMARQLDASGLLVQPQNSATMPSAAPRRGPAPSSGGHRAAKGRAGEEDGYDLAALEPGPQCDAGEQHLEQESIRHRLPAMAAAITLAPAPL